MTPFNVLDRATQLHRHHLLEASAGTGKTFSIQNIVARLLISNSSPLELSEILAVTFTRAAARDLRQRIRATLEEASQLLSNYLKEKVIPMEAPDYLQALMEEGEKETLKAKKKLQHGLHLFDQAQIFTIHAFCHRMLKGYALESGVGFHAIMGPECFPPEEMKRVLHDFLRTQVREPYYSKAQLEILLKADPEQKRMAELALQMHELTEIPAYDELYAAFCQALSELKNRFGLSSAPLLEDFHVLRQSYRQQPGETQSTTLEKVGRFSALFDQQQWSKDDFNALLRDQCAWCKAFNENLLKKQPKTPGPLHFPELTRHLMERLVPILSQAGDPSALLIRMAKGFRAHVRRFFEEEERIGTDDLLRKMKETLKEKDFLKHIQAGFKAVIIDEFQDTDPLQWSLFKTLFLSGEWPGCLYLVGDPKQSIYSFRQADIYTYLDAAKELGSSHCFSLNVNYRSQESLVKALNCLFSIPALIGLPLLNSSLPYMPVLAAKGPWEDERGAIHFFIAEAESKKKLEEAEQEVFFPFMAGEIHRIKNEKGFQFNQFAVLVKDRHQAQRLAHYFQSQEIPYLNQKGISLAESKGLHACIHLVEAVLRPEDRGVAKRLLASPLMGWTEERLNKGLVWEEIIPLLHRLGSLLRNQGFAAFYDAFLRSSWEGEETVLQSLLSRKEGLELYEDLQQIAETVIDHYQTEWHSPEEIVPFLDRFPDWEEHDDPRAKRFNDPLKPGVNIITLHYSKGLEYDVVFALGLVNQGREPGDILPVRKEGTAVLCLVEEESQEYRHHLEEMDAEKMRQFYVALTRAKCQLYIPFLKYSAARKVKKGEASPLDLYLAKRDGAGSYDDLYEAINRADSNPFVRFLETDGRENGITFSRHQLIEPCRGSAKKETIDLIPSHAPPLQFSSLFMTSFTQLNKAHVFPALSPPHDLRAPEKTIHTLPAGAEMGIFLHSLLEKICFKDPLKSCVLRQIRQSPYAEWEEVICRQLVHVMQASLGRFTLADLQPDLQYREHPFLMPYENEAERGVIKGVIDLVFQHERMYYLVDWKSNWLGPTGGHYAESFLKKAVEDNGYALQVQIYKEAFRRYLSLVETRPFEACFGGVYYIFLRGVQKNTQAGIIKL
ncbi:MAG: UvrD-helicase domain-containing protein [Parachlamydia sp.]|nr:UvrD-helicase domain-containing protein [Parachlamydia sp.]